MAVRYAVLGSGSKANAYIFESNGETIVVDNGFPLREFKKRAESAGFVCRSIKTIFLTHTHKDHVHGLENLLEWTGATLVYRKGVKLEKIVQKLDRFPSKPVDVRISDKIGGVDFFPFELHHDAPGATGYHFKLGQTRFTLITDTGKTDALMLKLAARSDVLFLEANYCPQLLQAGPYPQILRDRVSSDRGHLSNWQTVEFLNALEDRRPRQTREVYLVHLSQNNNTVERLKQTLDEASRWSGNLRICERSELVVGEASAGKFDVELPFETSLDPGL